MQNFNISKQQSFYALGISYKKADAVMRGKFSLDTASKATVLMQAEAEGLTALMVTSTCNRTEIYGFADHPYQLIKLLCENSLGTVEEFQDFCYIYKNHDAVHHMFRVGTGLDSQILGDFEIISQLKSAFAQSKSCGLVNTFLERLVNSVIQASKKIKNETNISSGATSVSFAAVQYIIKNIADISSKNILLFGIGKIGTNTCENLVKHSKHDKITVINRTLEKAERLAQKLHLIVKNQADLIVELEKADVVVVATGALEPTLDKTNLNLKKPLLILDLSIPKNVNENVQDIEGVTLIHLDDLALITDENLEKRKLHIPQAELIIEEVKAEFLSWNKNRKFAPTINALKEKLNTIKQGELNFQRKKLDGFNEAQAELISDRMIQKITNQFVNYLKSGDSTADEIALINKIFQLEKAEIMA